MKQPKSVLSAALESSVVPWATSIGFRAHTAYSYMRAVAGSDLVETFDFQRSKNPGDRKFTVNLGCWDPRTGRPVEKRKAITPIDCAEHERIGRLMPRNPIHRTYYVMRYGSYQPHLVFLAYCGDFWWSYKASVHSATSAVLHARAQLEAHGIPWLCTQHATVPVCGP